MIELFDVKSNAFIGGSLRQKLQLMPVDISFDAPRFEPQLGGVANPACLVDMTRSIIVTLGMGDRAIQV